MWIGGISTYRHPILFKLYPTHSSFPDSSHLCVGADHRLPGQPRGCGHRRTSRSPSDILAPDAGHSGSLFLVKPDKSPDNLPDNPTHVCFQIAGQIPDTLPDYSSPYIANASGHILAPIRMIHNFYFFDSIHNLYYLVGPYGFCIGLRIPV
jgi:hypothetical protein